MNNLFKITCLLAISFFISCGSDDNGGSVVDPGPDSPPVQATYRLTFTTNFTEQTHPNDYPTNATFGPVLGFAHNLSSEIYSLGTFGSDTFTNYIQTSDLGPLVDALTPTDDGQTNDVVVSVSPGGEVGATSSTSVNVTVTPSSTRISFIAKLEPSPDWFVGIDSFNLLGADNLLIEDETIELFPLDAGIDTGTTYTSDASPNSETIKEINTFPFSDGGGLGAVNPLATLRIERIN